jgi:glycopeptide antibiotics resistance protein
MPFFSRTRSSVYGVAYVLFLLVATLYPFRFHFTTEYYHHRLPTINWFPFDLSMTDFHSRRTWADYFSNVILFVPFGFLGFKACGGISRRLNTRRVLGMLAVGLVFSAGIEFTQLFTETRFTSMSDVICDTIGTALGALLAAGIDVLFAAA